MSPKCEVCDKYCGNLGALTWHKKMVHDGKKSYDEKKIISLNLPVLILNKIEHLIKENKFKSRSDCIRKAIDNILPLLHQLLDELGGLEMIYENSNICTVNIHKEIIQELEDLSGNLKDKKHVLASRSALIRVIMFLFLMDYKMDKKVIKYDKETEILIPIDEANGIYKKVRKVSK